ncbi:MAG: hypothetical protein IT452_19075 [Planctomycetia bacterium]|nr:hypothetical protein [Planctomycetia bacterium]
MFCQYCGTPVSIGGAPCPKCGGAASAPAPPAGQPGPFAPQPGGFASFPQPAQRSSLPWFVFAGIGCLGLVFVGAIVAAIAIPTMTRVSSARSTSRKIDCKNHLKQMGVYVALHEAKTRKYPPDLRALWRPDLATSADIFICPVTSGATDTTPAPAPGAPWESFASRVSYEYRFPERGDETPPDALMAWDRVPHPDGKRCVLLFQGRVDEVDQATFERLHSAK